VTACATPVAMSSALARILVATGRQASAFRGGSQAS
jgi:hypothetical protein